MIAGYLKQETRPISGKPRQGHRKLRILAVDDLTATQEIISLILTTAGHHVDCAANGNEAIELFKASRYDLILMDVQMPEMNGKTATGIIRRLEHPDHEIPIIAMTGNAGSEAIEELKSVRMTDVISKPFRRAELVATVLRWTQAADSASICEGMPDEKNTLDFSQEDFDELVSILGTDAVLQWIEVLQKTLLPRLLAPETEPAKLRWLVHDIVAKAGLLGFRGLAESCARLEQEMRGGQNLQTLAMTQSKARHVYNSLPRLQALLHTSIQQPKGAGPEGIDIES